MTDLLPSPPMPGAEPSTGDGPDWPWLPDAADAPTDTDLARYRAQAARLLADHGVSHGSDDTQNGARDWRLDPVPVVVHEQEWAALEAGLVQRAELLDAVLADLYGPQRLLRDDLLPPELVLGHPGFLRAVHGLPSPGARRLVLSATDLCRDPAGAWTVMADRTQAPAGAGYAMEDRRVVARVLAGVYRQAPIQRIGPFFHALRLALRDAAPRGVDEPRVVLLTSGPYSATAFDQAYLASMLGLPMVEGSDLVVRDGRVWAQGVDGAEQVDVVLRRIDDDLCDPLELRADSRLGVPGLVRALRAGSVGVVNPLGSSVLENPGLLACLPRLAREVLGQDLRLGAPATFWCGEESARAHVLTRLDRMTVRPTTPHATPVDGWLLGRAERDDLADQIRARPELWVGQEPVDAMDPATGSARLRAFAVAHGGDYQVMRGGLARLTPGAAQPDPAPGPVAKDVWVVSSEPDTSPDSWVHGDAAPQRIPTSLSPRTAENLFWMGRYAERAEGTVRALRAAVDRWEDFHRAPGSTGGRALAVLLAALDADEPRAWVGRAPGAHRTSTTTTELRTQLLERWRPGTVAWSVRRLAEAAAAVRDQLSQDTWLPLASMERALADASAEDRDRSGTQPRGDLGATGMGPVLDRLLEALLAVAGIGAESMVLDAGWRLLDAGRRTERALGVLDALDRTLTLRRSDDVDSLVVESVLLAHESILTYRRRNQSRASVTTVLDLLLTDASNPRSLAFQLGRLREDLAAVPTPREPLDQCDRLLHDLADLLTELDTTAVALASEDGRRDRLADALESLRWRLRAVADEINRVYFTHPTPSRAYDEVWGASESGGPGRVDDEGPEPGR
ncbi:circularly permuted type 2 ATP-grasp protein [Cellulomonas timonensis]|uniref:circularly permuted type 2 ATP-grasp protein n=1 Tax=Cellulomonas timonensis TaxID=1689271 RepID=UPI0008311D19|nr:circularly permuted type 2 ATP-grasp protein [Cellulomonas timonensis]